MDTEHQHEWHVVSTIMDEVALLVACWGCPCAGLVYDPTLQEWESAYTAPSKPYRWSDPSRVHDIHNINAGRGSDNN